MKSSNNIFIICTGLGRISRGFESFSQECFDTFSGLDEQLTFFLFKGKRDVHSMTNVYTCWNIPRNSIVKIVGASWAYKSENFTFVISLLPMILLKKPAIIMVSDFFAACYLVHLKKFFRFSYKVLFSNGGPSGPPYIFDHVHQLTQLHQDEAIRYGEPPEKHTVIPYGFNFNNSYHKQSTHEINVLKLKIRIPTTKKIVISVGAINDTHKRMSYVIDEVCKLDDVYLIILGQADEKETPAIIASAKVKLPANFMIRTVSQKEVSLYYACADIFVLGSLKEGFGRVYIEALNAGLPVCAHDYGLTRELLGDHGHFADFTKSGALTSLLQHILSNPLSDSIRQGYHTFAYNTYSWDVLKRRYVAMMHHMMQNAIDL